MGLPILTTKLCLPPLRPDLVPRPRLTEILRAGTHRQLTLVCAQAGSGKTTLVSEWLEGSDECVTWLTLDESDNDPARFLAYLIAALKQVDAKAAEGIQSLLQSPQPPPPDLLLNTLVNEIAAIEGRFVLALDDYHVIHSLEIHKLLTYIVQHQPTNLHLVLMSREDPPLPLPRLRARNQVTELRGTDLRFRGQETADFLHRSMGVALPQEETVALERHTEGWIAGLQLAALSMKGRSDLERFVREFTGSSRYVLDYLIEEVFERQSEQIQEFLLKTSILNTLNAGLCQAVTGMENCQEMLETLEKSNLFLIPLDQARSWYRYHRLFRDLLRNRLHSVGKPAEIEMHLRASRWYQRHGDIKEAIPHALAAADWEHSAELLCQTSNGMLKRGEIATLLRWFKQLPEDTIRSDPNLCQEYAWPLILSGQFEAAGAYLDLAEKAAQDDPGMLGQVLTAKAYLVRAQGDPIRMVEISQRALSVLPKNDVSSRCIVATNLGIAYWHAGDMDAAGDALAEAYETARITENQYALMTVNVFQGLVQAVRGQLRKAEGQFKISARQDHPVFSAGLASLYLSWLHYEWNDLEESTTYVLKAIDIGERLHNDELLVSCWMMMAQLYLATGSPEAARKVLEKARLRLRDGGVPAAATPRLRALQVQAALAEGDLPAANQLAAQLEPDAGSHAFYRFLNLTKARLLLAQGEREAVTAYLDQCYQAASQSGWRYGKIAVLAHQAAAATRPDEACQCLEKAFELSGAERFIRTFADLGQALTPCLESAARTGHRGALVDDILAAIHGGADQSVLAQTALAEPLSVRELEVLNHLVSGLTNPEIAELLVISPGTVKTHVHNICGKLGVRNRTEAASRARELGLV